MNNQQRAYITAKAAMEAAENILIGREKSFLEHRGRKEDRLHEIEDETDFDSLLIEFYEDPEIVAMEEDLQAKRDTMRAAEDRLIVYALGIAPAGVRETLRNGAATQIKIRQKLLDLAMKLDTKTVKNMEALR